MTKHSNDNTAMNQLNSHFFKKFSATSIAVAASVAIAFFVTVVVAVATSVVIDRGIKMLEKLDTDNDNAMPKP